MNFILYQHSSLALSSFSPDDKFGTGMSKTLISSFTNVRFCTEFTSMKEWRKLFDTKLHVFLLAQLFSLIPLRFEHKIKIARTKYSRTLLMNSITISMKNEMF